MLGLRGKILIGFGGLLAILLAVSFTANVAFRRFARTSQRVLRDDLTSVSAANKLQQSELGIDELLQQAAAGGAIDAARLAKLRDEFESGLAEQRESVTLPAERDATARLAELWTTFGADLDRFVTTSDVGARRDIYVARLLPTERLMRDARKAVRRAIIEREIQVDAARRAYDDEESVTGQGIPIDWSESSGA